MNLIEVQCWRCGRDTACAASWQGLRLCVDCRRLRYGLEIGYGVGAPIGEWHPTIARWSPHPASPMAPRVPPAPAYRIVVPMRDVRPAELERIPDVTRLAELLDPRGAVCTGLTYAMAEEIATATLVESVALRFRLADGRAGVALWWDWRWHGALVQGGPGRITREHLEALVTGAPWPPPAVTCPRCLAEVRENADGSPRAHGPKRKCKGYWPSLMDCCWSKPISPSGRIVG
jgi:hypothetical protein